LAQLEQVADWKTTFFLVILLIPYSFLLSLFLCLFCSFVVVILIIITKIINNSMLFYACNIPILSYINLSYIQTFARRFRVRSSLSFISQFLHSLLLEWCREHSDSLGIIVNLSVHAA